MKKKKKKKGLGETASANITTGVKKSVSVVGKYGAGVAGLVASYFLLSKIPKSNITIVDKVLPGIAAMTVAYVIGSRVENPAAKFASAGLGIAGAADLIKKTVGPMLPAMLQNAIPTLSGLTPGYKAVNQGDYPPNYYKDNAFQGLGTSPYALSGNEALMGMGTSPYALSGMGTSPYALSGVGNN